MDAPFIKYIYSFFNRLVELHGFKKKHELADGQCYMVEYSSENFVIKIEKYFREFYASVYQLNDLENEINLFNLLEYLKQDDTPIQSEYYNKENDLDGCFRKQLDHISSTFFDNHHLIIGFYNDNTYKFDSGSLKFLFIIVKTVF